MKTIEQKAKAYDEALERARKLATDLPNGRNDRLYHVDDLEHIFPELAESEDERIRKEIISALKNANYKGVYDKHLSWLEKQGEPTDVEEPNFFDDFRNSDVEVDSNEDGLIAETIRYKKEQKPAWSEKDERIYQSIIDDTVQENQLDNRQINWIKSLKDRYTWKPSGEQMEALKSSTYCQDKQMSKILFEIYQDLKKLRED